MALTATADASFALGRADAAEAALREALPLARRSGSPRGHLAALRQQALIDLARGRLGAAVHACQALLGVVSRAGLTQASEVDWARLILGSASLLRGRVDEAAYHLDQNMAGPEHPDAAIRTFTATVQARLHHLRGEPLRGLETIVTGRLDVDAHGLPPMFSAVLALMEAELRLALGDEREAGRLIDAATTAAPFAAWTAIVRARLHLTAGDATAAMAAISRYAVSPAGASLRSAEACLLHAQALRCLGNHDAASHFLERSLRIANAEGLRQPFAVNAALVHDLLVAQLTAGVGYAPLITDLTGVAVDEPGGRPAPRPSGIEPLTERELIVLRHLRSTMSNPEIASMLCVSANTVKTHVKNVYRKLGVGRRRDAIRRAQEVGLI
nr:LuxR C-terminal-related transcriptional regulator [Planosporangium thailandense]